MKVGSRKICIFGAGIVSTGFVCTVSRAQVAPQPDYNYVYASGQSGYSVAPGGSVNVPIYLQETSGDDSSLLSSENGLEQAGVQANVTTSPSDPANITGVNGNAAFGSNITTTPLTFPSTTASISEFLYPSYGTGVLATVFPSADVSEVFLGTLTITAGNTPGETTAFTLAALPEGFDGGPIGNTFTYNSNYDLDANNDPYFGGGNLYNDAVSSTFTVTTTGTIDPAPLPPAWAMALAAMGVLFVARRRQGWLSIA